MAILTGQLSSSPSALGASRAKEQLDDAVLLADARDINEPTEDIEATLAVLLPNAIGSPSPPGSSPALRLRFGTELGNSHESGSQINAMATQRVVLFWKEKGDCLSASRSACVFSTCSQVARWLSCSPLYNCPPPVHPSNFSVGDPVEKSARQREATLKVQRVAPPPTWETRRCRRNHNLFSTSKKCPHSGAQRRSQRSTSPSCSASGSKTCAQSAQ